MKLATFAGLALLTLSACGKPTSASAEQHDVVMSKSETTQRAPVGVKESPAAPVDLSAYVGKYPFDVVKGHRFLDHPAVKAAIAAAVPDAKQRAAVTFEDDGLGLPIVRVKGGRILIWGGAKRAEDQFNWAVVIAPDGSKPEVCIYDGVGYGEDFQSSQWFEPGEPSIMKQGTCPSSAEDYPPAEIAAG
jgi:hypothetical protein